MKQLLILLAVSVALAFIADRVPASNPLVKKRVNLPLVLLVIILSFFCGLRTSYNDTGTYIRGFQNAPTLAELWSDPPRLLGNPLFYFFQSFFRHHISPNYHLFFVLIAFFTITSFLRFIRRYTEDFTFSILLFFSLGLYVFNLAATKQCIAMAVLLFAIPPLLKGKYWKFYLIVLIATLFHTYAVMFAVLPLFTKHPWTAITYISVFAVVFVLLTFEESITTFLEQAENLGKNISEEEVFDQNSINPFRLAVFSVPVLLSFIFKKRLNPQMEKRHCLMMNMSILSFLVMSLGIVSAANLFGRCAHYFEIGTVVILPWILRALFERKTANFMICVASVCYIGFFMYDVRNFSDGYSSISLFEFFSTLF